MVKVYCEKINEEMIQVARMISNRQKMDVQLITTTATMEVRYEEAQTENPQNQTHQNS